MAAILLQYVQYWMDQRQEFRKGDDCVQVAWIHGVLADYGLIPEWTGPLPSRYDDQTEAWIKEFQVKNKREPSGVCDYFTMRDLQRQWVIAGLQNHGLGDELKASAPANFYELLH